MKCPRCQTTIAATPDATGSLTCPGCGARLRSRSAPTPPGAAPRPAPAPGLDPAPAPRYPDGRNPNATLPPGTPLPRIPRPSDMRATPLTDMPATRDTVRTAPPAAPSPGAPPAEAEDRTSTARTLEMVLAELKALRAGQERILALLGRVSEAPVSAELPSLGANLDDAPFGGVPEVRARRRKSVLLLDDDAGTRAAAVAALEAAEVPVRTAIEGNAALAAIAEEKPDVIVMELDIGGSMPGKDVVNLIKATMEWVDVPILLYTRMAIHSQKEARTIHGADDFVPKQAGPEALVSRVITAFRAH